MTVNLPDEVKVCEGESKVEVSAIPLNGSPKFQWMLSGAGLKLGVKLVD